MQFLHWKLEENPIMEYASQWRKPNKMQCNFKIKWIPVLITQLSFSSLVSRIPHQLRHLGIRSLNLDLLSVNSLDNKVLALEIKEMEYQRQIQPVQTMVNWLKVQGTPKVPSHIWKHRIEVYKTIPKQCGENILFFFGKL